MVSAKIFGEELNKLHVTEDEGLPDEWRHTINAILSKVASAAFSAETQEINEEMERVKQETSERQIKFLKDHAVGSH